MTLTPQEIDLVCRMVNDIAGIQWDAEKQYLIESRLGGLLKTHQCRDLSDLVIRVQEGDIALRSAVVDAVTTRETLFFRDDAPFAALRNKALPEIIDARAAGPAPQRLRFWSAACSSGQEPYSLGITLCELLDDVDDWDITISATDLSAAAIAGASRGVYSEFEMSRGVSPEIRRKYFRQVTGGWQICDRVRSLVNFRQCNLLEPYNGLGPFDVIFCRNVAIYFDLNVKTDVFQRMSQVLMPYGAIFVGGSETLSFLGDRWKPKHHCRGVYYQPNIADLQVVPPDVDSLSRPRCRPAPLPGGSSGPRTGASSPPKARIEEPRSTRRKVQATAVRPAATSAVSRSTATGAKSPIATPRSSLPESTSQPRKSPLTRRVAPKPAVPQPSHKPAAEGRPGNVPLVATRSGARAATGISRQADEQSDGAIVRSRSENTHLVVKSVSSLKSEKELRSQVTGQVLTKTPPCRLRVRKPAASTRSTTNIEKTASLIGRSTASSVAHRQIDRSASHSLLSRTIAVQQSVRNSGK